MEHLDKDENLGIIERDQKGEFIEVEPEVVLRMIQELKKYQKAKKEAPSIEFHNLKMEQAQKKFRDKMDKETTER